MKTLTLILGLSLLAAGTAPGQDGGVRRGTITYVSGEVYYISLGSPAGMADSTVVSVIGKGGETIATMKVFAVSSKSSACRVVSSSRTPVVGDAVTAAPTGGGGPDTARVTDAAPMRGAPPDSVAVAASGVARPDAPPAPGPASADSQAGPWIRLRGRLSAQYQTFILDSSRSTLTQPSLSANLRGDLASAPIRFELAGVMRSSVTGSSAPFASGSVNRSRLYRISAEYNDGVSRVGIGRILPSAGLPSGYVDGIVASRRFGAVELGGAAGYEPDYRQERLATDRKKAMLFAGAGSAEPFAWSIAAAYARTWFGSATDRSVASASALAVPWRQVSFSGQAEIDFLSRRNGEPLRKARLSSLVAQLSARVVDEVSLGAGVVAWRPAFPLSLIASLPDSMRDDRLRVTPSFSLRVNPARGVSLAEHYSPRSSGDGFGEEYSNALSLGYDDVASSGVGVRLSQTINHTSIVDAAGYGVSVRRLLLDVAEAGVRYQHYEYDYRREGPDERSDIVGADLSVPLASSVYLVLGAELTYGSLAGYRLLNGSVTWRF